MKVLKFGGTSVGSAERMLALVDLVAVGGVRMVVLSAMSGTTNQLVAVSQALYAKDHDKAMQLIDTLHGQYKKTVSDLYETEEYKQQGFQLIDYHFDHLRSFTFDLFTVNEEKAVLAQGELISTALFNFLLHEKGIHSVLLPALNFMRIDMNAEPDLGYIRNNLAAEIGKTPGAELFVTQGYICRNAFGEIDNLKRGGSDYTATILGAVLGAEEVQIWTDIDGLHNNDPRFVSPTFPIAELSFDEAAELAYFGAKILHPTCILPAKEHNIPVRLLNTMQPLAPGTLITSKPPEAGIRAVAAKDGITAVNIKSGRMLLAYGFLRAVFEVFERYRKPIDMIATSEVAVSITIDDTTDLDFIVQELQAFGTVEVDGDLSIICIAGYIPADEPGFAKQIFGALNNIPLRMISHGGSENNISVVVETRFKKQTLQALNKGLFNLS